MPLQLPKSYWNDVNRYCGEILAGAEIADTNWLVIGATIQEATWEAETESTTATLRQGVVYYLGGLLRKMPTHTLSLTEPTPGSLEKVDYSIDFCPISEEISGIDNGLEFKPPTPGDDFTLRDAPRVWKEFFVYLGKRKQDQKEKRSHGFHLPAEEDYDRLHSELKRGASGKYTIRN